MARRLAPNMGAVDSKSHGQILMEELSRSDRRQDSEKVPSLEESKIAVVEMQ